MKIFSMVSNTIGVEDIQIIDYEQYMVNVSIDEIVHNQI
jgi:hypothetical protein